MTLKNHTTIDKLMLETAKDRAELIEYVTKNMERNLVEAMLDKIEPGNDYLIRLSVADYYEEASTNRSGYKMALGVDGWTPCSERLPDKLQAVNITWVNHKPTHYYEHVKDVPFTATAYYHKDKWWWYSPICEDMLAEYGYCDCDEMDEDIEVIAWMPLPEPYKEK